MDLTSTKPLKSRGYVFCSGGNQVTLTRRAPELFVGIKSMLLGGSGHRFGLSGSAAVTAACASTKPYPKTVLFPVIGLNGISVAISTYSGSLGMDGNAVPPPSIA